MALDLQRELCVCCGLPIAYHRDRRNASRDCAYAEEQRDRLLHLEAVVSGATPGGGLVAAAKPVLRVIRGGKA